MAKILAIDLGTTYFKIAIFDRDGRLHAVSRVAPPLTKTPAGILELPANALSETIARGMAEVAGSVAGGLADVDAVTFATQTNSFLLLDAEDRPLTPVILWPDARAAELEAEIVRRFDAATAAAITGIPCPNCQFMPAKLVWLQRNTSETWRQMRRVLLISDYFTFLLTGKYVTEAGAAGLTGLVDIHACQWSPTLVERFGLKEENLPTIVRAGADVGTVSSDAQRQFGLPAHCRVVVGCLDQYAGAIGVGNVKPGMISETTGTVLATVRCTERTDTRPGIAIFQGPGFRAGQYWQMVFGEISANWLEWYCNQLPDKPPFADLVALAEAIPPGCDGLRLNTDAGLLTDGEKFTGRLPHHARAHEVRAILEGVASALKDQTALLSPDSLPTEIRCAGGAARSDLWLQIKANMLGTSTASTQCDEPTSLGAAMLAEASLRGVAVEEIAGQWARVKSLHSPEAA